MPHFNVISFLHWFIVANSFSSIFLRARLCLRAANLSCKLLWTSFWLSSKVFWYRSLSDWYSFFKASILAPNISSFEGWGAKSSLLRAAKRASSSSDKFNSCRDLGSYLRGINFLVQCYLFNYHITLQKVAFNSNINF